MTFIRYAKNQKIGKTNDFKVLGEIKPKGGPNRILKIV
jgi:hypothetical protein